jgi:uracil-DNA glycosylase
MKRSAILLLIIFAFVAGYSNDETGDDKRLDAFLNKVENFYKNKEQVSTNWNMPNRNPESTDYNMPTGNMGAVDHETGLIFNSSNGKLLDSELNIELDTVTGMIYDFKTKKEYLLSDLQSQRHKKL